MNSDSKETLPWYATIVSKMLKELSFINKCIRLVLFDKLLGVKYNVEDYAFGTLELCLYVHIMLLNINFNA